MAELKIKALFNDLKEPKEPQRLYSVNSITQLPSAKKYIHCQVYIIDTKATVVSDGAVWS